MTDYCTTDELKYELGSYEMIDDGRDDVKFTLSISAASRQVDARCGQRFWQDPTAVARTFAPRDIYCLSFTGDGISTVTGLVVKIDNDDDGVYETTLSTTDYVLHPTNAAVESPARPYTELRMTGATYLFSPSAYGRDLVQITAKWGWPAIPDAIKKATLVQAADLFKAKDAAFGIAGANEFGPLRVTSGLNRMAESLVQPYCKMNGIA